VGCLYCLLDFVWKRSPAFSDPAPPLNSGPRLTNCPLTSPIRSCCAEPPYLFENFCPASRNPHQECPVFFFPKKFQFRLEPLALSRLFFFSPPPNPPPFFYPAPFCVFYSLLDPRAVSGESQLGSPLCLSTPPVDVAVPFLLFTSSAKVAFLVDPYSSIFPFFGPPVNYF